MKTIVVIADHFGLTTNAIEQASYLSLAIQAKLHVVFFHYEDITDMGSKGEAFKDALMQRLTEKATHLQNELSHPLPYSSDVVWQQDITTWVNHYVTIHDVAMVVKTAHCTDALFYTPTDWALLRECPAPILIASKKHWRRSHDILACVDLQSKDESKQQLNQHILSSACHLAKRLDVKVQVLYVPPFSSVLRDLGVQFKDEIEIKAEHALADQIHTLTKQYQLSEQQFYIHAGKPWQVIPSIAAKVRCQLVVLGTVGRRGIGQKVLGNTAEKILRRLKTNVLALKPSYPP
ncbi:universal stress protein [Thalassotalea maritima]|uniref:universal stress protein n=1 Tax=Thalassotalea maritima TaxID=3242416 RepID=UPI003526D147